MKDYLQNKKENREFEIKKIFSNVNNFEEVIKRIYKNINVERTAKRQLYEVKQIKSAFKYAVIF